MKHLRSVALAVGLLLLGLVIRQSVVLRPAGAEKLDSYLAQVAPYNIKRQMQEFGDSSS
ncbi:MAG: hypothetical protein J7M16_09475 [Anaerolineae bacterium]|nr:hypothetical protein [Anaerolineae bacterium]